MYFTSVQFLIYLVLISSYRGSIMCSAATVYFYLRRHCTFSFYYCTSSSAGGLQ